jgi:3-phytase
MKIFPRILSLILLLTGVISCSAAPGKTAPEPGALKPRAITEPTKWDTDDPAFWIPADRTKTLIVGTDKNADGALYVYDLAGKVVQVVSGLKRPNNVDVAYGLVLAGQRTVDIAVTTEREMDRLRIFAPAGHDVAWTKGDLVVFNGDRRTAAPMGIALYTRPTRRRHLRHSRRQVRSVRGLPVASTAWRTTAPRHVKMTLVRAVRLTTPAGRRSRPSPSMQ